VPDGRIVLLGAPLGNPGDASGRFRSVLASADLVAAEDTRKLARLARDLEVRITGRVVSYFAGNEPARTRLLVATARDGGCVALVTDGGMPSVSDPGYQLVVAAHTAGVPVTVVPGPSAVTTALAVSGLPGDRFCFEGFPPRRGAARRSRFAELATEPRTLVFFEAPHRIAATLADLAAGFGADRPAALCRELTKPYEQVRRGGLGELAAAAAADPPRGEITLVVAGAPAGPRPDDAALRAAVAAEQAAGASHRDAAAAVARAHGLPRREVYQLTLGTQA
jgi:16S rRNA (cytidine1402-2'-O)-methyltransferase